MKQPVKDKQAAILQATLELISEQGFHGTPMSQIAERANVGVGTIYRYFANKEELINALYLDVKKRLAQHMLQEYSPARSVRDSFLLLIGNIMDFFLNNPAELLFIEQYANSPLITHHSREEGFRTFEQVHQLFEQARHEALLKPLPLPMLSILTYGATLALVKLWLADAATLTSEHRTAGITAIWDAIRR